MTDSLAQAASPICSDGTSETFTVQCTSQGQTCTPTHDIVIGFSGTGASSVEFQASPAHCSDILVQFFVDGTAVSAQIGPLGPGQGTGSVSLGVLAGSHTVGIQATGILGGCNTGTLAAWGGSWSFSVC
jgi:hypothetical protein